MSDVILEASEAAAVPVRALGPADLATQPAFVQALATTGEFKAKPGQLLTVPDAEGALAQVLFGLGDAPQAMMFRALPARLPAGVYRIAQAPADLDAGEIALAFALGSYRFDR